MNLRKKLRLVVTVMSLIMAATGCGTKTLSPSQVNPINKAEIVKVQIVKGNSNQKEFTEPMMIGEIIDYLNKVKVKKASVAEEKKVLDSGNAFNIIGIVHHLVFYNELYLQRFKQGRVPKIVASIAETFEYNHSGEIEVVWDDLRQRLDSLFDQWEEAIFKGDDAKFDSQTPDSDELWWSSLAHLAIHNAYHIGQIVYIRKEQGLWETWED